MRVVIEINSDDGERGLTVNSDVELAPGSAIDGGAASAPPPAPPTEPSRELSGADVIDAGPPEGAGTAAPDDAAPDDTDNVDAGAAPNFASATSGPSEE